MFNSPGMAQTACLDQLSGIHTNENHLHPLIKYNIKSLLQFGEVEKYLLIPTQFTCQL